MRPRRSLVREQSSGGPPIAFARFATASAACRTWRRRRGRGELAADAAGTGKNLIIANSGRARYVPATDEEALAAFRELTRTEGIIPALEPSHALARARELDAELIVVCLSGRGDKDLAEVLAQ